MSHSKRQGSKSRHHPSFQDQKRSFISLKHLCRPTMIVFLGLMLCWGDLHNTMTLALHQTSTSLSGVGSNNGLGYYYHQQQPRSQQGSHHHHPRSSNVRLRAPHSLSQLGQLSLDSSSSSLPLGGAGITPFSDEANIAALQTSPMLGPTDLELSGPRRKKDCGEPSIATRGLLGPTLKRSYFATTQDEMEEKIRNDEFRTGLDRKKREIQHHQLNPLQVKRDGASGSGGAADTQDSPLPWTCETKYEWKDMGSDHYPRFVRTAECKSRHCFNGFFRCRPRRYKTKVLKRVTPADSSSCEDDDVSLPEGLRTNWKFITVTINLCCDCSGRIPGNTEV